MMIFPVSGSITGVWATPSSGELLMFYQCYRNVVVNFVPKKLEYQSSPGQTHVPAAAHPHLYGFLFKLFLPGVASKMSVMGCQPKWIPN
jgi:hypothetical protein